MKILVKYLWSVLIIPMLVFLKGDLSFDTYISINKIEPIEKTRERLLNDVVDIKKPQMLIKVEVQSSNKDYSGAGTLAQLYDENYNLIGESQVVNERILFTLEKGEDTLGSYKVVIPSTADELSFQGLKPDSTLIVHADAFN